MGDIAKCTRLSVDKIHSLEQRALLKMRRLARLKHLQDFVD
jgi:DNA-directed RNA polymerase sigma subunit (sigma70/sigma32)